MTEYQIGAYEALEWIWLMLRNYVNNPKGVETARQLILETLMLMGGGENLNFSEKITEAKPVIAELHSNTRSEPKAYYVNLPEFQTLS